MLDSSITVQFFEVLNGQIHQVGHEATNQSKIFLLAKTKLINGPIPLRCFVSAIDGFFSTGFKVNSECKKLMDYFPIETNFLCLEKLSCSYVGPNGYSNSHISTQ